MKRTILTACALFAGILSFAQSNVKEHLKAHFKPYGFIRDYVAFDTRESISSIEDFFYYLPKDERIVAGEDLNAQPQMTYSALTTRLGLDVVDYEVGKLSIGAKIEADFYAGVTNVSGTATFRLRQAYVSLKRSCWDMKIGQAWHPMAADMPDVISLNTGAPFAPFSRTPLVQFNLWFNKNVGFTAAALWQMQYNSNGPAGTSADYIKYSCIPEGYLALNFAADGFLARVGGDVLCLKPRNTGKNKDGVEVKVNDRITTVSPYVYMQYSKNLFSVKAKTIFSQAGEHMNLNAGYGVSGILEDGSWTYAPTQASSSWISLKYGKKLQGILFGGYVKNFGTTEELLKDEAASAAFGREVAKADNLYFCKNSFSNMNQMYRISPTIVYNIGKLALGIEYEFTSVQYGKYLTDAADTKYISTYGLADDNLHWVSNHRVVGMVKFSF